MRSNGEIARNCKSMENRLIRYGKKKGMTLPELEAKHENVFAKQARYMGNGIYSWCNVHSVDTRELFLLGVLIRENQPLKNNYDE